MAYFLDGGTGLLMQPSSPVDGVPPPVQTYHLVTQSGNVLETQSGLELRKVQST